MLQEPQKTNSIQNPDITGLSVIEILEVVWVGILLILVHSCRRDRNGRVGSMLTPGGSKVMN